MKQGVAAWAVRAFVIVMLFWASRAGADDLESAVRQAYPTNEGLLTQATTSAVERLFLNFRVPQGASLRLEPANENRANWFVETQMLSYLSEAGYTAFLAKPHARMSEAASAGPDAGSRTLSPVRPRPQAGSLSAALDSSTALRAAKQEGDSALAVTPDSLATADTLVVPETHPSANEEPVETATPLTISEGSDEADYVLRYRVVSCELSYPEKHRTSPLGSQ